MNPKMLDTWYVPKGLKMYTIMHECGRQHRVGGILRKGPKIEAESRNIYDNEEAFE